MNFDFDFKLVQKKEKERNASDFDFEVFQDKPFYCWDRKKTGLDRCCFNHIVGLPLGNKDMKEKPFWEHHQIAINRLFDDEYEDRKKRRHVRVKKATGLAFSELGIRLAVWLPLHSNKFKNTQIAIVTGPNIELSRKLISRIRYIFSNNLNIQLGGNKERIVLNGCEIQAYPAMNLSAYRGLANPKFILLDEADFFGEKKKDDMWEVRYVTERYINKSNPYIMMVSTPNRPGFLYETMDREDTEKSIYQLLSFNWEWGVPPKADIFNAQMIQDAKDTFTFEREYNLKYLGEVGNVFSQLKIKKAFELGKLYDTPPIGRFPINKFAFHPVGIDPGFGTSRTAVTVMEWIKEAPILRVVYHDEFEFANPDTIADLVFSFNRVYGNVWYYVDGANRGFVSELKARFGENLDWHKQDISEDSMHVIPVNFATDHKTMLSHLHVLVNKELVAIPERFDMIHTAMSTAIAKEYQLDKTKTSYDDSLDSLRLAAHGIRAVNR